MEGAWPSSSSNEETAQSGLGHLPKVVWLLNGEQGPEPKAPPPSPRLFLSPHFPVSLQWKTGDLETCWEVLG